MSGPQFTVPLPEAPEWVREGVSYFQQIQRDVPFDPGTNPSKYLRAGEKLYFPNAVMHWHAGKTGFVVALCAFVTFLIAVATGAVFMDGVPAWSWIGLVASLVFGLVALVYTAKRKPKPGVFRTDGMYLLPQGAAFVRQGMCSWTDRHAIEAFELTTGRPSETGSASYLENMTLRNGDRIVLAVGKRPRMRAAMEAWRVDGSQSRGRP